MKPITLICLMLCLFLLFGCSDKRYIKKELIRFTSCELVVPDHLIKIENGSVEDCSWPDSSKVFVKYYGPGECSSCALRTLYEEGNNCVSLCDSLGVVPMAIFTPFDEDESDLIKMIMMSNIEFPTFIDVDCVFFESSQIPPDIRFHNFLVDVDKCPNYVGNPLNSTSLKELFLTVVQK